ncbi:MAG TPA: helix-turn-helix domain-containing protein [Miltoncostaeaceae bacterium]|nr:helix-turn-helix domain-containing protein [Miltoncostaeaceae bacterium]
MLQRGHCRAEGITELDPLWVQIARTARGITELLDGFAGSLRQVAALDRGGVGQPVTPETQILDALIEHGPMSPRRLAAVLDIPAADGATLVAQMLDAGLLTHRSPRGVAVQPSPEMRDAARAAIGTRRHTDAAARPGPAHPVPDARAAGRPS